MAYLMHIAFDNSNRLVRDDYCFEYKKICFKLVQNDPRKWSDVLLTIIQNDFNTKRWQEAYDLAGEFLSALCWENSSSIALRHIGGNGIKPEFDLHKAKCLSFSFPEIPFQGMLTGYGISQIAHIENANQRIALTLYREAESANKIYFKFLLFWQILEIQNGDAIGWINKMHKRKPKELSRTFVETKKIILNSKNLGNYFLDDCRHAIAHIRRKPGKLTLNFDDLNELERFAISTHIIKEFAKHYIKTELELTKKLYLVYPEKRKFPFYIDKVNLQKRIKIGDGACNYV